MSVAAQPPSDVAADAKPLPRVVAHTDGGAAPNPGPGAWAAVLQYGGHAWEISGAVPATTNNRMELQAAIQVLRALNRPCAVEIHTDSDYLRQGITAWIHGWKRNGWRTSTKEPVKNRDLWVELDELFFSPWIGTDYRAGMRDVASSCSVLGVPLPHTSAAPLPSIQEMLQ